MGLPATSSRNVRLYGTNLAADTLLIASATVERRWRTVWRGMSTQGGAAVPLTPGFGVELLRSSRWG